MHIFTLRTLSQQLPSHRHLLIAQHHHRHHSMAKPQLTFFPVLLLLAFSFLPLLSVCFGDGAEVHVKGMFVFGSSLVDNGNNNFLRKSKARADYAPYGIDFPGGPSGRFSNGRNAIDVLGELLELPALIPPFADPRTKGARIVHGVNFASGGSGILDQTGSLAGEVMSLSRQIKSFEEKTLPELKSQLGRHRRHHGDDEHANHQLAEYLFVVGSGGNDYLLNYFAGRDLMNRTTTLSDFTQCLISTLSAQLRRLYDLGARKFVLFSIQPMGCVPVVRAANLHAARGRGGCVEPVNQAALLFNSRLRDLAAASSRRMKMPGATVVFVNSYKIIRDIIENPYRHGFSETGEACCEVSSAAEGGSGILCRRGGHACSDRESKVFFDGLHPTDAVNVRIARKAYWSKRRAEAFPMNVHQLANLSI